MNKKIMLSLFCIYLSIASSVVIAMDQAGGPAQPSRKPEQILLDTDSAWQAYSSQLIDATIHHYGDHGQSVLNLYQKAFSIEGFNKKEYKIQTLFLIALIIGDTSLETLLTLEPIFVGSEYTARLLKKIEEKKLLKRTKNKKD
jgi:hypothetical protein